MRKLISLFILVFVGFSLLAQQDPQLSLNKYNILPVNPGFAGSNEAICASLLYRQQWMGFDGAPKTMIFSGDMSIPSISSGVGINVMSDKLGFEKNTFLNLNYAYKLKIGDGSLGIGLGFGFLNKSLDGEWKTPDQLNNPGTNPYLDPLIPHSENKFVFDANLGVFYRAKGDKIYCGISSTHLTQPDLKYEAGKMPFVARHYYVIVGSFIQLPDKNWGLIPSAFIKSDGKTNQYDLNAMIEYRKQFRGGISYRFGDAIVAMVGFTTQSNITFALAYDFTISKLKSYESGSVEFMAKYCFNLKKAGPRGTSRSVRFL
ncbi:MAG: type IX secretion system membrane protein PorP/SprF [Bacteroidia bacterium]|nr:type IX secretion system membrane protein PorP/SprF [Bacteroidia bacterium]